MLVHDKSWSLVTPLATWQRSGQGQQHIVLGSRKRDLLDCEFSHTVSFLLQWAEAKNRPTGDARDIAGIVELCQNIKRTADFHYNSLACQVASKIRISIASPVNVIETEQRAHGVGQCLAGIQLMH